MVESRKIVLLVGLIVQAIAAGNSFSPNSNYEDGGTKPIDICNYCNCSGMIMICDYRYNRTLTIIWDSTYFVPSSVTSIEVRLAEDTNLELGKNFFNKNIVNRLKVTGIVGKNAQLEIKQGAFLGNQAGYPDIRIENVSWVFVRSKAFSRTEIKFQVEHSQNVRIENSAFDKINMTATFKHINNLEISPKAFTPGKGHARLRIENANIGDIYFETSLQEMRFVKCNIGTIKREAFNVLSISISQLILEHCHINTIESRAFTDKLHSDHVSIADGTIGIIDSEAIMSSGITNLTFKNNTIDVIKSQAIVVYSIYVNIYGNRIRDLNRNWLELKENPQNLTEDRSHSTDMSLPCTFTHNQLKNPHPGSLNLTRCRVHHVIVERDCDCKNEWLAKLSDKDFRSEVYCRSNSLQSCFNETWIHTHRYTIEACDTNSQTLRCSDNSTWTKHEGQYYSPKQWQEKIEYSEWARISFYVGILLILIIIAGLFIYILCKCCARKKGIPNNICPTFSEIDIQLINEGLQNMRRQRQMTSNLERQFRMLLRGNLTTMDCEQLITDILAQRIDQMIIAVLSDHMMHHHPGNTATAPIESFSPSSDNSMVGNYNDGGLYSSTDVGHNTSEPVAQQDPFEEHIYTEPLLTDYSDPADPASQANYVYTDPYIPRQENNLRLVHDY
ncbi:uncharacterized protein LOC115627002 isoform X2 [Scaptodrosophila lebanonensis]|uniref:Uncharacterized protein LOC115627002 isoform X2 n=1 Tax=Drosophila lebanonensis TaxID=7225 RepID=A0A6J2TTB1_DROLE|nr:uncharacterized protein LOC115627002 isoform X2 [Scaptodrosophila lebanonensis]